MPAAASLSQSHSWSWARLGRERLDPVRYPHCWITEEMSQPSIHHPHWWREIKASGNLNLGTHIVHEGLDEFAAQHHVLWQAASFRLPVAQQEASGWWDAPPVLHGFCPQDFLPLPLTPGISRSSNRRRNWLWPGCCRSVQRHPEPSEVSYFEQSGSFNNA